MKLSIGGALIAALALAAPVAAKAQSDAVWWICADEIKVSSGVASAGGLMPALKRIQNDNIYTAIFQTPRSEIGQAEAYAQRFHAHLDQTSGHAMDGSMLRCVPEAEAKVRQLREALEQDRYIGYSGAGGITIKSTVIDVDWRPEAAKPPEPIKASAAQALDAKVEDLTPQAAKLIGLTGGGAMIASVEPDGAAAKAGLKDLDVITEISGQPVANAADLAMIAAKLRVGFNAPIRVWRDKAMIDLTVAIPMPASLPPAATALAQPAKPPALRLGMTYGPAFEDLRKIVGDIPTSGAFVSRVFPGGPADLAGIKPLDVIVSIRDTPIETQEGLKAAVVALPEGPSTLKVWRSGVVKDLTIDLRADRAWPDPVDPGPYDPVAARPGVCMNRVQNIGKEPAMRRSEIWPVDHPEDEAARLAALGQFIAAVQVSDPTFPTKPQKVNCGAAQEGVSWCATYEKRGYFAGVFCGNDLARLIEKYTPDSDRLVAWRPARP
ncbi:PDZ domain-containing protein [Caulobacter sp.]|uniref:PDZ domain-containing protein n=1 Tax=Caulobacter sp. TaxID=78 RepID=UPI001B173452|nr:PDZ domain-containing protein [Caulobacter sp.]MBO9542924.1 PDZ domain-containing protein [Caulobacter sp.]